MLARLVDEAAERFGDASAYLAEHPFSYRLLADASDQAAVWLLQTGVQEGDVVALALPPCPEYMVLYAAAAKVGAITTGVNTRLTPAERSTVIRRAAPSLVVHAGALDPADAHDRGVGSPPLVHRIALAADPGRLLRSERDAAGPGRPPPLTDDPDRPVAIVFTSGTTGTPRGAVFAGRQLAFITQTDTGGRWGGGGRQLAGTSFAHVGPMTKLPGNLMRGGTTVLTVRWTARIALEATEHHQLSTVAGIPTQVALMLRDRDFDRFDLSSVRAVVMGGGPSTPALVREARSRFGAPVAVRYSCTEAGVGLGTAFDAPTEDAEVSVGRPHPGVELSLVDESLEPIGRGEVGEVCLRSPATMTGYWQDPRATAEAFTPTGAVRTGDLGWLDDRGRLRLAGRKKELYVRGGYNVHPVEVEAVLVEHPAVADVAVVPRVDDVMGEIGVAVAVAVDPGSPPSLEELRRFAEGRLARHKLPEQLVVVDELPLTAMEKVDRRALARQVDASPRR
jgi:acyl-CoA synthetase (AMP-forming)/AMP-acid ligase II